MEREFGLVIVEEDIARLLGFPSARAFRQSVKRGNLAGLKLFRMEGRPGWRIVPADLAAWFDEQRSKGARALPLA